MMQEMIEQMVKEILSGIARLDPVRQQMFLIWLGDHTSQVRCAGQESLPACLVEKLMIWMNAMSLAGMLWEYRLVMDELEWWRDLEQASLEKLEAGQL